MHNIQLPDGSWVTTPFAMGIRKLPVPCEAGCDWKDIGDPTTDTPRIQMQQCSACGFYRGRYLDRLTEWGSDVLT